MDTITMFPNGHIYMFSDCEKTVFVYVDGHVQQAPKKCEIYIYIFPGW
jgi:prepilin-type processing-associated H-X9-DG protein